ncbi:hypothetical protein M0R45_000252 [Rubus argutus]|uniref:Uncharacterized protein n=1 Tax=Rubus argutus TaxID=59490 RepID=A0AAW1VPW2_RUBAR
MSTGSTRWRDGGRGHGKAQLGQCGIERISLVVMGDGEMKLGHRQKHEAGRADCLSDCCCLLIIVMVKLISAFCRRKEKERGR